MEPEKKKKLLTAGISCAVIFTILYLITNFTAITAFFGSIFSVLTPVIVGAAIAYLLNPILKLFEYKIFKKLKNKAVRRALSLILTYVVAVLVLAKQSHHLVVICVRFVRLHIPLERGIAGGCIVPKNTNGFTACSCAFVPSAMGLIAFD